MVEKKDNPVGIDTVIDNIQRRIYEPLKQKWGDIDIYGRVYKKKEHDGTMSLERYTGNGEYKKVLFSEGNKIFFVQGNNPKLSYGTASNDLWIVCSLKLGMGFDRNDEESHIDLTTELYKFMNRDSIKELQYGTTNLKNIVEEPFEFGSFEFGDVHPYHVFMLKTNVSYEIIENQC